MADQTLGSEIDVKPVLVPGLNGRPSGSGRRRIHAEGKQQCLWLGTGPEAESVLRQFKESERRAGFKRHKDFLEHVLATFDRCSRQGGACSIERMSVERLVTSGSNGLTTPPWNVKGEQLFNGHNVSEGQQSTSAATDTKPLVQECSQQWPSHPEPCTESDDSGNCSSALVSQSGLHFGIKLHSGQLVVGSLSSPPISAHDSDHVFLGEVPRKRKRLHNDDDDSARAAAETLMELGGGAATLRTVLPESSCFSGILSSKTWYRFTVISGDSIIHAPLVSSPGSVERGLREVSPVEDLDCYDCVPVAEVTVSGGSTFIVGHLPLVSESLKVSQQGIFSVGTACCVEPPSCDEVEFGNSPWRNEWLKLETGEEGFENNDSPSLERLLSRKLLQVYVPYCVGLVGYSYSSYIHHVMFNLLPLAMQFLFFIVSLQYIGVPSYASYLC